MIVVVEKGPGNLSVLANDVGGDEGESVGASVGSVVGLKIKFLAIELFDFGSELEE